MAQDSPRRTPGAIAALVCVPAAVAAAAMLMGDCGGTAPDQPAGMPAESPASTDQTQVAHAMPPRARAVVAAPEETAEPLTEPDPVRRTESRVIQLVDELMRPVVGARLDFLHGEDADTDAEGRVTREVEVGVPLVVTYDDGFGARTVDVTEPVTELTVSTVDVLVATFDCETGSAVAMDGLTVTRRGAVAPESLEHIAATAGVPGMRTTSRRLDLQIATRPTDGYAAAGTLRWNRPVSVSGRRVRIDVPVFPVRTVTLRPVASAGESTATVDVRMANLIRAAEAEVDSGFQQMRYPSTGDAAFAIVPRIPANFATFDLASGWDDATNSRLEGTSAPVALGSAGADLVVEVPMTRVGGIGGLRSGSRSRAIGCCSGQSSAERVDVTLRVLRRDGSPAANVVVSGCGASARSGSDGLATLRVVRADADRRFTASAHGFLPTVVVVPAGSAASFTDVVESTPRQVRVFVVDGEDRPVPGARVFASSLGGDPEVRTIAQMDGDTEIGTPRTGPDGSLLLDVCEGLVRYEVALAGAATALDSDAPFVRVVLGARQVR